jgi:hypothetical protein
MADFLKDIADDGAEHSTESEIQAIAEEMVEEIHLGQIEDDVSTVLEQRLEAAGIALRPEALDSLAEDIENDASR